MLRLLTDEDFNGNVVTGVRRRYPEVDVIRAQEAGLSGQDDRDLLAWAAGHGRILLTNDKRTMIAFARQRVVDGLPMPGVFVLRRRTSIQAAIEAVAMVALASDHASWDKQVEWLPF